MIIIHHYNNNLPAEWIFIPTGLIYLWSQWQPGKTEHLCRASSKGDTAAFLMRALKYWWRVLFMALIREKQEKMGHSRSHHLNSFCLLACHCLRTWTGWHVHGGHVWSNKWSFIVEIWQWIDVGSLDSFCKKSEDVEITFLKTKTYKNTLNPPSLPPLSNSTSN